MNWGLFLALVGFLLPLALALRVAFRLVWARAPLGRPVQMFRLMHLALLSVPIAGKAPAAVYAVTGRNGDLGAFTEAFMVTPWGWTWAVLLVVAVLACDLLSPRVVAQLQQPPLSDAMPTRRDLGRDAGVIAICLFLAWAAQL